MCWWNQAIVCACQAVFMAIQYPKIGWEPIYMASCEAITYGLYSGGYAYVKMWDGKIVPWVRCASWTVTCPVILLQIGGKSPHQATWIR